MVEWPCCHDSLRSNLSSQRFVPSTLPDGKRGGSASVSKSPPPLGATEPKATGFHRVPRGSLLSVFPSEGSSRRSSPDTWLLVWLAVGGTGIRRALGILLVETIVICKVPKTVSHAWLGMDTRLHGRLCMVRHGHTVGRSAMHDWGGT